MGFLLFAARKLQLKREINNKNYELMVLTSQYNQAQKRVAQFQEQMENAKQMTSVFAQAMSANAGRQAYTDAIKDLKKSNKDGDAELATRLQNFVNSGYKDYSSLNSTDSSVITSISQQANQVGSAFATAFTTVTDSIFDAANKVQLAQLKAQENSLELRKSSLESEVALLDEEYKAVKSKEGEAIKDAVPQFGLA